MISSHECFFFFLLTGFLSPPHMVSATLWLFTSRQICSTTGGSSSCSSPVSSAMNSRPSSRLMHSTGSPSSGKALFRKMVQNTRFSRSSFALNSSASRFASSFTTRSRSSSYRPLMASTTHISPRSARSSTSPVVCRFGCAVTPSTSVCSRPASPSSSDTASGLRALSRSCLFATTSIGLPSTNLAHSASNFLYAATLFAHCASSAAASTT
mmetsp:Transcript_5386/g.10957  ORF Transcript_5386/g.10957 Transcript_5386/m.10957 type:complete len:211 (-) Transcript_5386:922-1554(-)